MEGIVYRRASLNTCPPVCNLTSRSLDPLSGKGPSGPEITVYRRLSPFLTVEKERREPWIGSHLLYSSRIFFISGCSHRSFSSFLS
jgi:hypothetical protein